MNIKIALINPNTTKSMTSRMHKAASPLLSDKVDLVSLTAPYGASSIEGFYDEIFAVPPMIEVLQPLAAEIDGVVVGCFDDTGVDALRTILDVPVIGICQAAMHAASIVSHKFTIITTLNCSVPAIENLVTRYGFDKMCSGVRAAEIPVLDLESNTTDAIEYISKKIEQALSQDGADAIVLGCAGMVDLTRDLTNKFNVPVIDGVGVAVKTIEGLVSMQITTSKIAGYAPPRVKYYSGVLERFSPSQN
ncbi:MAG: hypothetical protein CBB68_05130 [Rhodospirillaceae bacterium TMED8]|nr:Asp/Glu/hydantoin racemase [Magnetovibrio sp.]OUT51708.1 MAG: hypothetical protein CBB68_05130 [Rhodospirillaceae bacterium TMED8]|tara:strand:+ start:3682 stop:4425 length:744 start_codon:yes stop_codon:yes gene_type:complete